MVSLVGNYVVYTVLIQEFGRTFGQKLWNSRLYANSRASTLESPKTIQEYYDSFSEFLNDFFFGVIDELYQKKTTVCNWQRKRRYKLPKTVTSELIMKTVTFITSMFSSFKNLAISSFS